MSLDAFMYQLHADSSESKPHDWTVDWEDAPLPYKLYRGAPTFPLSSEVPLSLIGRRNPVRTDLDAIGHFLWYVNGLTRLSHPHIAADSIRQPAQPVLMYRRNVPSGGGLYPNEVYMYLKIRDVPAGVYHYDAAHHRLVLLREGDFDDYLTRSIGDSCDVSACFGVVFISTVFWKNYFKYHNFAYRLQGLDAGVLIGQSLETARRFGFHPAVCFQFLDRAVLHLLGLPDREESVYATIPLSVESTDTWFFGSRPDGNSVSADELIRGLPTIRHERYERSRNVKAYPMLARMNDASMLDSTDMLGRINTAAQRASLLQAVYLPPVSRLSYDLASMCRQRFSPESEFVPEKVTQLQIASLLHEAAASFSYLGDLDGEAARPDTRVHVYACIYHVEGIPDGAYRYDMTAHALERILPGDHRLRLQYGMSLHNVSLFHVPICLHIAGDKEHLVPLLGYRGYRIQQMEAGMLLHRILIAASAVGMGGRPLLGFHSGNCDEIYRLRPWGRASLIQIPIGPHRARACLEGGLHG